MNPDDIKQLTSAFKLVVDNSEKISFGAFFTASTIIVSWVKMHKKFIVEPREKLRKEYQDEIKALKDIFENAAFEVKRDNVSNYNRIKEIDQLLELQDNRIEKLEQEDKQVIANIAENTNKINVFRERLLGSETRYTELKEAFAELRRTDSDRQQAMGKIQGILEFMIKN